jgi:hypothetical protein
MLVHPESVKGGFPNHHIPCEGNGREGGRHSGLGKSQHDDEQKLMKSNSINALYMTVQIKIR